MGRWSVFLTLGVMLFPAVVNSQDCPLNGQEEHAWLIRLTPMLPIEDAEGSLRSAGGGANDTANGGPAPAPAKVFKFNDVNGVSIDAGLERNLRNRHERGDPLPQPLPLPLPAKPPETPGGEPPGREPQGHSEKGQGVLEPGVTAMHGALVKPNQVLTVLDMNLDDWFFMNMKKGYLSLVGYNAGKNCSQEQWGLNVNSPDFSASFALNSGLFLIITSHDPFAVDGEPFLFGPKGYPPVADIIPAYHTLAKNPQGNIRMYLFKDKKNIKDGSTVTAEFNFIPWKRCGVMSSVKLALTNEGKGIDAQVATEHFFCSLGIPGISSETIGVRTDTFGFDWHRGAPVIFTKADQTKLPIGYYVYRVGLTGEPRIYATYNSKLSKILGGPGGVHGSLTIPPPDPEGSALPPDEIPDGNITETPDAGIQTSPRGLRGKTASPTKPTTDGSHVAIAEIWFVLTCAFASATQFA